MSFYELLLRGVRVEPGKSDRDYLALMNKVRVKKGQMPKPLPLEGGAAGGGEEVILALGDAPPKARGSGGDGPKRARVAPKPKGGAPPALPLPPAVCPPPAVEPPSVDPAPPPPPPVAIPPEPVVGDEAEPVMLGGEAVERGAGTGWDFKPGLDGATILCMRYHDKRAGRHYRNWIIKCPRHAGCFKKRLIIDANVSHLGDIEPPAYLHAWLSVEPKAGANHSARSSNPKVDQVIAYATGRKAELEELVDRLLVPA